MKLHGRQCGSVFTLLLALLAVGLGLVAYWYHNPGHTPQALRPLLQYLTPLGFQPTTRVLYRWQDEHGRVQVSDRPPPPGYEYERIEVSLDANVVPSRRTAADGGQ